MRIYLHTQICFNCNINNIAKSLTIDILYHGTDIYHLEVAFDFNSVHHFDGQGRKKSVIIYYTSF